VYPFVPLRTVPSRELYGSRHLHGHCHWTIACRIAELFSRSFPLSVEGHSARAAMRSRRSPTARELARRSTSPHLPRRSESTRAAPSWHRALRGADSGAAGTGTAWDCAVDESGGSVLQRSGNIPVLMVARQHISGLVRLLSGLRFELVHVKERGGLKRALSAVADSLSA